MSAVTQPLRWVENGPHHYATNGNITFRISTGEYLTGASATLEFLTSEGWRQLHYHRTERPIKRVGLFQSRYTKTSAEVAKECLDAIKQYAAFLADLPLKVAGDGNSV
jgi:hypothetical protein